jgi:hypothetical protein
MGQCGAGRSMVTALAFCSLRDIVISAVALTKP